MSELPPKQPDIEFQVELKENPGYNTKHTINPTEDVSYKCSYTPFCSCMCVVAMWLYVFACMYNLRTSEKKVHAAPLYSGVAAPLLCGNASQTKINRILSSTRLCLGICWNQSELSKVNFARDSMTNYVNGRRHVLSVVDAIATAVKQLG